MLNFKIYSNFKMAFKKHVTNYKIWIPNLKSVQTST